MSIILDLAFLFGGRLMFEAGLFRAGICGNTIISTREFPLEVSARLGLAILFSESGLGRVGGLAVV